MRVRALLESAQGLSKAGIWISRRGTRRDGSRYHGKLWGDDCEYEHAHSFQEAGAKECHVVRGKIFNRGENQGSIGDGVTEGMMREVDKFRECFFCCSRTIPSTGRLSYSEAKIMKCYSCDNISMEWRCEMGFTTNARHHTWYHEEKITPNNI